MRTQVKVRAAKTPMVAASEYRFEGSSERGIGAGGEINAANKRELINKQQAFLAAASRGEVTSDAVFASAEQGAKVARELVQASFNDPEAHRVLGERMADSLYLTANRQGFMRKYLTKI